MNKFLSRNRAVTLGIVVIGLALLVMLLPNLLIAVASPDTTRGAAADGERWERMAQFYLAQATDVAAQRVRAEETTAERIRADQATAQRWEAMAEFYTRKAAADRQRANDALGARWQAMAEFYAAQNK
jgi:hypothetical protein